ncbi:MAG: type VI secretion system contractile sheath small subunit [Deltaproteobacteria bacterium]|nr:type VI secretion system contractile sheath small subunit [Deltaproteobacteria bacterium]
MSDNRSVAPKERVNIVYKSATDDKKEMVELPFKLMVLGDFSFKNDTTPLEEKNPVDIDKNNFDQILESMNIDLDISVKDKVSEENDSEIPVNLKFRSMKDFKPESIAQQVPELKKIIEIRQALMAVKSPLGNIPALRKTIQNVIKDDDSRSKLLKELGL